MPIKQIYIKMAFHSFGYKSSALSSSTMPAMMNSTTPSLLSSYSSSINSNVPYTSVNVTSPQINFIPIDIVERQDCYIIRVDIPNGIKHEDVKIEIEDNMLTISGERVYIKTEEECYHKIERHFGPFYRSVKMPENIDRSNINAYMDLGVLDIVLNKLKETLRKKTIPVFIKNQDEK